MRGSLLFFKFIIICNFILGYCFCLSKASVAQPCIKFEEIYYDFGEISKNDLLTHIFKFENIGNNVLTVEKIKSA
jgi:hypothetical protein